MPVQVEKYRFGPYEVRVRTREIYKFGTRLKLRPQPFQVLQVLVERAGDVVTREELRQMLWPGETFVDFEHGLNTSVKELRRVLSDSASQPRYIETLPRLGYRIVAPVEPEPRNGDGVIEASPAEAPRVEAALARVASLRRRIWLYVVLAGAVLAAWLIISRHWEPENSMPAPLTSFPGRQHAATWSPDGRQVAFMWDGEKEDYPDIYVLQPGSSQTLRLTMGDGYNEIPAWSPDGRWIAYVHVESSGGRHSLNLVSPLGGPVRTVVTSVLPMGKMSWFPDGRAVVLEIRPEATRPVELWVVWLDSGKHRVLTSPPPGIPGDASPAVSPDGRTVAFCRATFWRTAELYLLPLKPDLSPAGAPRRVTDLGFVGSPAWTPDGSHIVFDGYNEGAGLSQIARSGGHLRPILGVPPSGSQPAIARRPGGYTSLIFTNTVSDTKLWQYSSESGLEAPVEIAPSTGSQGCPRYSPDGKRLAFGSDRSGYPEIWVANADGTNPVQLTDLRHVWSETPEWSPSGDQIAFLSQDRAHRQIYVINAVGGPATAITNQEGVTSGDGWSRDGNAFYYTSTYTGRQEVWRAPLRGGRPEQITTTGGLCGFETSRGIFYYWKGQNGRRATLMWRAPEGDRAVPLAADGIACRTSPSPTGFYFRSADSNEVYLYDEAAKRSIPFAQPDRPFSRFAVSPDGQLMTINFDGKETKSLMIMEHFR